MPPINLDEIALAALEAKLEGVEASQVNKLIELLESSKDVSLVKVFIARQAGRKQWSKSSNFRSATRLWKILSGCRDIDEAKKVLGMFKWFYEAGSRASQRVLDNLKRQFRNYVFNPSRDAPSNFADTYLRSVLGL